MNTNNAKNTAVGVLKKFGAIVNNAVFGADDNTPDVTQPQLNQPHGRVGQPAVSPREQLIDALTEAIADYNTREVLPYVKYALTTRFRIQSILIRRTSQNAAKVDAFKQYNDAQRVRIAKELLKTYKYIDSSNLADVTVAADTAAAPLSDIINLIGGAVAADAGIVFEFHGEFTEAPEVAAPPAAVAPAPAPTLAAQATPTSATPQSKITTLLPPAPLPSRTATLLPTGGAKPQTLPAVTITISEPGLPLRSQSFTQFPVRIGRSEMCEITVAQPYVSRVHLTLLKTENGDYAVADQSATGSSANGASVSANTPTMLKAGQANIVLLAINGDAEPVSLQITVPAVATAATAPDPTAQQKYLAGLGKVAPATKATTLHPATPAVQPAPANPRAATLLTRDTATAITKLVVRYADGTQNSIAITALPFEIGREPQGDRHFEVIEAAAKVSRTHITIIGRDQGAFVIENNALAANGTFIMGDKQSKNFSLLPVTPRSESGWVILGGRELNDHTIAVRLEAV